MFKFLRHMAHSSQLTLLKVQLVSPMQTYHEIAVFYCELERELQDPELRKAYNRVEIKLPYESESPKHEPISLKYVEQEFERDDEFAGLVVKTRQEISSELITLLRNLRDNPSLLMEFRKATSAPNEFAHIHDVVSSLKRFGALSKPTVPASPELVHDAEELAALLR